MVLASAPSNHKWVDNSAGVQLLAPWVVAPRSRVKMVERLNRAWLGFFIN
jgi:hypothetical protein